MRSLQGVALLFLSAFFLWGCANQVTPGGGPKDTQVPVIRSMEPENYSVRFHAKEIRITFDEYIQLKDLPGQLVVSPPLSHPLEAKIQKKMLTLKLQDTLKANTTYSMNFGKSIEDLHEGNPLVNFSYVFSTGDFVDTLYLAGRVTSAAEQKPEKDVKVLLYREEGDSLPYKSLPLFFGVSNEKGEFRVSNISEGEYKIFALKETNNNYLYDSPDESIAFLPEKVHAGEISIALQVFHELPKPQLQRVYSEEPGKVVMAMNRADSVMTLDFPGDTSGLGLDRIVFSAARDTAVIWYRNVLRDSLTVVFSYGAKKDTSTLRLLKADEKFSKKNKFALRLVTGTSDQAPVNLTLPLSIYCSHPIVTFEKDSLRLYEDSIAVKPGKIAFVDEQRQHLEISYPWKENKKYTMFLPALSMTDIYGLKNDSLKADFRTRSLTDYGSMQVKLKSNNYPASNIFQLVNESNVPVLEFTCMRDTTFLLNHLIPGTYRMRLVYDKNKNGKEDTGHYLQRRQPEPVLYYPEKLTIRANWDVEASWSAFFPEEK